MGLTIIIGAIIGFLLCFLWSAVKLLIAEREKNERAQAEIRALEDNLAAYSKHNIGE